MFQNASPLPLVPPASTACSGSRRADLSGTAAWQAFVDGDHDPIVALLAGRCNFTRVSLDMQIHANDTLETESAHGTFVVPPKLTVAVMLDGDLDAALDGQPLGMTAHDGPNGYLWINRREARLERWLRAGQRVRKVLISVPLPVAASSSDKPPSAVQALMACVASDRTVRHWQPSAQAVRHAEEILAATTDHEPLDRLEDIISALGILRDALAQSTAAGPAVEPPRLATRDVMRARKARSLILEAIEKPMAIGEIASRLGMSVSTLQRIFKATFGTTVNQFIRVRRLELARLALLESGFTVAEAAFSAGYTNASNFSTAFSRVFGYPPSACLKD